MGGTLLPAQDVCVQVCSLLPIASCVLSLPLLLLLLLPLFGVSAGGWIRGGRRSTGAQDAALWPGDGAVPPGDGASAGMEGYLRACEMSPWHTACTPSPMAPHTGTARVPPRDRCSSGMERFFCPREMNPWRTLPSLTQWTFPVYPPFPDPVYLPGVPSLP